MSMDRAELADRIRQELQKRADAILFGAGYRSVSQRDSADKAGVQDSFSVAKIFREGMNLLRERMPRAGRDNCQTGRAHLSASFRSLGYEALDYGAEIDWYSDRVHGKRAPRKPWFQD